MIPARSDEVVPDCGSYEVRFPDGRPSKYFYFENLPGRRLQPVDFCAERYIILSRQAWARAEGMGAGRAWMSSFTPLVWHRPAIPIRITGAVNIEPAS